MNRPDMHAYRRNRAVLKAKRLPCHLCGGAIDYDAKPGEALAFEADHVLPVARGGANAGELKAAHSFCNKRRGARPLSEVRILKTSRQW